ncbi:Uma2 family endonuclease [Anatilimnocola sp. NA78]|uniref:Uma2 family endonuclease n=1 Tax=Anatilimnocola sp. NA78 TaxID=3415683 RepID=UPI003CE52E7A
MIVQKQKPGACFILEDVSWQAYEKLLEAFADRRFPHTYVNGTLEIMTLSHEHEAIKKLIARFVENISVVLQIRMSSAGSITLKEELKERGLEPDECYYIANAARVRGIKRITLEKHPPPDLVIEVDITRKSLNRFEAYAQLGVPEIWRYERGNLYFFERVSESEYKAIARSLAFPMIARSSLQRFLKQHGKRDEFDIINDYITWLQTI